MYTSQMPNHQFYLFEYTEFRKWLYIYFIMKNNVENQEGDHIMYSGDLSTRRKKQNLHLER